MNTNTEYRENYFKKLKKIDKQKLIEMIIDLNLELSEARRNLTDAENRLYDIKDREYSIGYSDGMKRMLETIEKVFSKGGEHD